ncbi:MAG: hypothetical protein WCL14_11880 [Bacteroidota bacterium]
MEDLEQTAGEETPIFLKIPAKIISILFHPLLMPVFGMFLLFHYKEYLEYSLPEKIEITVYKVVVATTLVFPILMTIVFKLKGTIETFEMKTLEERRFPFLFTAIFYMFGYYLLKKLGLPTLFYKVLLGATISVLLSVIVNLFWKISVHLIGIGGIIGTLLLLSQIVIIDIRLPLLIAIFIAGITGTARLILKEHSPAQLYIGFFIGFLSEFMMLWIKHL